MHLLKIGTAKKVYNNIAKNHLLFYWFYHLFDQSTINKNIWLNLH